MPVIGRTILFRSCLLVRLGGCALLFVIFVLLSIILRFFGRICPFMLCWPGKIKRGVVSFYFLDLGLVSDVFIRAVIFGGAKVMVYNCNLMKTGKVG